MLLPRRGAPHWVSQGLRSSLLPPPSSLSPLPLPSPLPPLWPGDACPSVSRCCRPQVQLGAVSETACQLHPHRQRMCVYMSSVFLCGKRFLALGNSLSILWFPGSMALVGRCGLTSSRHLVAWRPEALLSISAPCGGFLSPATGPDVAGGAGGDSDLMVRTAPALPLSWL